MTPHSVPRSIVQDAWADLARVSRDGITLPALLTGKPATGSRPAAVLVLLGRLDDVPAAHGTAHVPADLDVLLLQRASALRHHPGQVAFPGGRLEPADAGPVEAALREAREETGLDTDGVEVLGTLAPLPLPISNHLVTPVLAWWARPSPVRVVDDGESAAVFRVPVADLVDPANRGTAMMSRTGERFLGPAFEVDGTVVWGFTAFILSALLDALGWAEPWDESCRIEVSR